MKSRTIPLLAAALAATFAACSADITGNTLSTSETSATVQLANLVECPTTETATASGLVTPLGGTVSVGGTSILIPAGALLSDAVVTVTVPASRYLEVDISVQSSEHFVFESPVTVTMSYARCTRANLALEPLSAWYIDSDTKAPLEKMPSVDDKLSRTVTFTTGHLSGYAIAN